MHLEDCTDIMITRLQWGDFFTATRLYKRSHETIDNR
jgi:hypothetical protein